MAEGSEKKGSRRRKRKAPGLPGSRPTGPPRGMRSYLVLLTEPEPDAQRKTSSRRRSARAEVVDTNLELTARFRAQLQGWLEETGQVDLIEQIGPPQALPTLTVTCEPVVAQRIRKLDGVEAVVEDSDDMGLLR